MKHLKLLLVIIGVMVFANVPASTKDFRLHQAVLDNNLQLVTKLLNKGAAIDVIGSRKYGYGSALHLAVREGHVNITKLLLDRGAQVDVLDPDDFTPLHNAAWNGNLEMAKLLLDAGADINASTYDGDTPLKLAQNNDQAQVAEFIQAKLQAPSGVATKVESTTTGDSGVRDVSGTYVMTNLTGNWLVSQIMLKPRSKDVHEVTITQNGDQLIGTYDEGKGSFWGEIKGDTIKLEWVSRTIFSGNPGRLTFKPGSNDLSVTLSEHSGGEVKFNLTKIEPVPAQIVDISGTYISEITVSKMGGGGTTVKGFMKRINGKEITLEQTGNAIRAVGTPNNKKFIGTRMGNTISFYILTGNQIIGTWEINADATEIVGKWYTDGGGGASGKWNLKRIK